MNEDANTGVRDDEGNSGLSEAQIRLLVENHRRFRDFLVRRVGDEAVAEDILQHSLRKAVETPARSDREESVLAWFYRILRNALTDHYRRSGAEREKLAELTAEPSESLGDPWRQVRTEICHCLGDLLPLLKPEYATVLSRIDLGEETPDAVARELGISRGNLDVRLHRAREALRKSLVRVCGTCTEHGCLNCSCK